MKGKRGKAIAGKSSLKKRGGGSFFPLTREGTIRMGRGKREERVIIVKGEEGGGVMFYL